MDISRYFASVLGRENLLQRLECEYKEGKAYRYYANGFVGEVKSNMMDQNSKYCYFRTKCLPSHRVSAKQYDVWVICEKDRQQNKQFIPGGRIMSAYCTCISGLLGKKLI